LTVGDCVEPLTVDQPWDGEGFTDIPWDWVGEQRSYTTPEPQSISPNLIALIDEHINRALEEHLRTHKDSERSVEIDEVSINPQSISKEDELTDEEIRLPCTDEVWFMW